MFKHLQILWNYLLLELEQPFRKCPIQTTFDKVIKHEYYSKRSTTSNEPTSQYMCIALTIAERNKKISSKDAKLARTAIKQYLRPVYCGNLLDDALTINGLPSHFEYRLKIYQNWAKRPKLGVTNG